MKWINEKTVQGDPMDIKNYYIPKEDYNIPLVNEGIQEGRKLVRCKDCKYWQEPEEYKGTIYPSQCTRDERADLEDCNILMDADDFCSRGELKRY